MFLLIHHLHRWMLIDHHITIRESTLCLATIKVFYCSTHFRLKDLRMTLEMERILITRILSMEGTFLALVLLLVPYLPVLDRLVYRTRAILPPPANLLVPILLRLSVRLECITIVRSVMPNQI